MTMPDYIVKSEVLRKYGRRCDLIMASYGGVYIVYTLSGLESGVMRRTDLGKEPSLSGARNLFQQAFESKLKESWKPVQDAIVDTTWMIEKANDSRKQVSNPQPKPKKPKPAKVDRNITFDL